VSEVTYKADGGSGALVSHRGGCHCGRVRYEARAAPSIVASRCNCSICTMSGYLAMLTPAERFTLLAGASDIVTYTFNTGRARHTFCRHCGIKSFYHPRSHPDGVAVNVHCLEPETVESITVEEVDGRNWESHYTDGTNAPFPN